MTYTTRQRYTRRALILLPSTLMISALLTMRWMYSEGNIWFGDKADAFVGYFFLISVVTLVSPLLLAKWIEKRHPSWVGNQLEDVFGPGAMLGIVFGAVFLMNGNFDYFNASDQVARANANMSQAALVIGRSPEATARLAKASQNYDTYRADQAFVDSLAEARTGAQDLTLFLAAAQTLDAPVPFVRQNGIIRKEDETELLNRAMTQSGGEQTAVVAHWVAARAVQ